MNGTHVVIGLGEVDPALVEPFLPDGTRFLAETDPQSLADAVGAVVRADVDVDRDLMDRMPRLRVLARTGVGVDRIDMDAATERGIPVVITPGAGTNAVAEGTLAMALHLVKDLRRSTALVREDRWRERTNLAVGDLEGRTIGVIGYGRIGRRVAELARVFGMTVLAYDPFAEIGSEGVSLDELRDRSDVISLHLPLTEDTRHLVDSDFLAKVPHGCILINCGRGGLVDLDAVHDALRSGGLAGVGLDVFETEPPAHHPLFDRDDVVLSPHHMGLSARATARTFAAAATGIADVIVGRQPAAVANPDWHRPR